LDPFNHFTLKAIGSHCALEHLRWDYFFDETMILIKKRNWRLAPHFVTCGLQVQQTVAKPL
jgi:hypothetical protein